MDSLGTDWLDRRNNGEEVCTFLDLKKACDTVSHDKVLRKMETYGFRGIVLDWSKNYILTRQQCKSRFMNVPQGPPVVGPEMFIMYINAIGWVSNILKFVLFTDDTYFLFWCRIAATFGSAQTNKLKKVVDTNKLSLNLNKTNFMLFGNQKRNIEVKISIERRHRESKWN